jgi:hypothetical protein
VFLIHPNTFDSKTRVLLDDMSMVETHKKRSVVSSFSLLFRHCSWISLIKMPYVCCYSSPLVTK